MVPKKHRSRNPDFLFSFRRFTGQGDKTFGKAEIKYTEITESQEIWPLGLQGSAGDAEDAGTTGQDSHVFPCFHGAHILLEYFQ